MLYAARVFAIFACLSMADVAPAPSCGCDSSDDEPNDIVGAAVITSIEAAPPSARNCEPDAVIVQYDFMAQGASAPASGEDANRQLVVGDARNPARAYVQAKNIEVGKRYRCVKHVYRDWTSYDITALDLSDYAASCSVAGGGR